MAYHILIVDVDAAAAQVTRARIARLVPDATLTIEPSPERGRLYVQHRRPDVLIIDPSPRNLECGLLIKFVKETYPGACVIVLTSEPMPGLRSRMCQLGVDVYLEKSVALPSLVDVLSTAVRQVKERAHVAPASNDGTASKEEVMYDLVIIGGGPAALSAACYAAGKNSTS